ncbi:hypothetical protein [Micromonospora sp. LA-10]|uniref:hypothetical protein n=1 Tax=Micromonospora sp. LA-10 TaxID=3446364 RepID=UPI003F72A6CD
MNLTDLRVAGIDQAGMVVDDLDEATEFRDRTFGMRCLAVGRARRVASAVVPVCREASGVVVEVVEPAG